MRPLTVLGQGAAQIAEGHYEFHFRPSGLSEIDTLASQITNMSQAVKVREQSIITSEQRFRDLVNSIDGIVWEMEYPSFRFLFVSRQVETILGYPVQNWYEDHAFWEKKTHVEDMALAKAYCQLMSEKHLDHDLEYRMIAADGRIVWIRDLVTVVVEDDRPVRLLGVMIDVTVQKELLDELSRSEQNYREIFNSTSDAIFIHDAETGRVMDVNQSMLDMFNCSYEEALDEVSDADKTLEIHTRIVNDSCEIYVRDNGPGMSEEVMARIFEPMFSTKNFGVGFGVPIIKNILEGHGGGVEYLSEVGKGTTVAMWLPLASENTS